MYGWTPDYIFNRLTGGQLMTYYRYGIEIQYGKIKKTEEKTSKELSPEELKAERERLRKMYGTESL